MRPTSKGRGKGGQGRGGSEGREWKEKGGEREKREPSHFLFKFTPLHSLIVDWFCGRGVY